VSRAKDEQLVEALRPHRAHPALRKGVCPRRSHGRLDDPDALESEHLVEAGRELGIPIPYEEPDAMRAVCQISDQVAGHLGDEGTVRMTGDAEKVHFSR
jgi:hypothetical protein